jgi:hypothetical protein
MEQEMSKQTAGKNKAAFGRRSLRAVGNAYMHFARHETGLFRTAFSAPPPVFDFPDPSNAGRSGLDPFQLLGLALDRMVQGGVLAAGKRAGAEFLAWSCVHGLSLLILDGPLKGITEDQAQNFGERILDLVEHGLN